MKLLRPICSVLLALLVLVSSTSFMVGVHHCNGTVASVALFSKATPCAMEQQMPPCHKAMKPCCSDESIVHKSEDFKPTVTHIHIADAPLLAELASPIVISELIPAGPTMDTPSSDGSPPLPPTDIHVVIGKFQI